MERKRPRRLVHPVGEQPQSWDAYVSAWLQELEIFGRRHWTLVQYGGKMERFSAWSAQRRLSPVEVEPRL